MTTPPNVLDALDEASIIVCCGSGGVGKTTTAAAIAFAAARRGRRAVVVTIDPAKRLADAFGLSDGLGNAPSRIDLQELAVTGELWAMMLDTRTTFDELVMQYATDDAQARRILDNRFYGNISGALSGTQEYMASEKLYALHQDDRFDVVVVDTPPTRNALDFLHAPATLTRFLDHRLYRWLTAPARGGMKVLNVAAQPILRTIGRVVGADVLADAIAFFQAFEGMETGFRARAAEVSRLLASSETSYVVVSSPRHDTVEEASYFIERLTESTLAVSAVVVNRMQPTFSATSAEEAGRRADDANASGHSGAAELWRNLRFLAGQAEAETTTLRPLVAAAGDAVIARVPLRSTDVHDIVGIAAIADDLGSHGN